MVLRLFQSEHIGIELFRSNSEENDEIVQFLEQTRLFVVRHSIGKKKSVTNS